MRITIDAYITKSGRVTLTDLHVSEGVLDVYLDVDGIRKESIDKSEIIRLVEGKFRESVKEQLQGIISGFLINHAIPNSKKIAYRRRKM